MTVPYCHSYKLPTVLGSLHHQVKDRTIRRSILNFWKIPWNSAEMSKFRRKGKIPRLGSKFHDPWKTVGHTDKFDAAATLVYYEQ